MQKTTKNYYILLLKTPYGYIHWLINFVYWQYVWFCKQTKKTSSHCNRMLKSTLFPHASTNNVLTLCWVRKTVENTDKPTRQTSFRKNELWSITAFLLSRYFINAEDTHLKSYIANIIHDKLLPLMKISYDRQFCKWKLKYISFKQRETNLYEEKKQIIVETYTLHNSLDS